jgi:replicative DNA helicase
VPTKPHLLDSSRHLPPVGPVPSAAELLCCALVYSAAPTVVQIAEYLDADSDLEEPAASVYRAVVELARQGISPAPELVLDELRRTGRLDRQTACRLATAATAGAPPETARRYAAIVVSNSLRRQLDSLGNTLANAASTAAEDELKALVDRFPQPISTTFGRLAILRGDVDE